MIVFAAPSPTGRKPGTLARLAWHPYKGGAKGRDMFINQRDHIPFIQQELRRFLPAESTAAKLSHRIGAELHYILVESHDAAEFSSIAPIDTLYQWAILDGGIDPEWFCGEGGIYRDDNGEIIPVTKPSFTATEQLAAYGLWLLDDEMLSHGPIPQNDADIGPLTEYNDHFFRRDVVIEHQAACMLLAYQALSYCQRIASGAEATPEEKARAAQFDFSALGKKGANKRHGPMQSLREWAVEKYRAGKWQSANQAAYALKDSVVAHGRTIGAILTEGNAQNTIYRWLRKYESSR